MPFMARQLPDGVIEYESRSTGRKYKIRRVGGALQAEIPDLQIISDSRSKLFSLIELLDCTAKLNQ